MIAMVVILGIAGGGELDSGEEGGGGCYLDSGGRCFEE